MNRIIVYVVCLICLTTTGCGSRAENDSALAEIESGVHIEEIASQQMEARAESDNRTSIKQEDYAAEKEKEILPDKPENGHIIAHNPDYRAPVYTVRDKRNSDGTITDGSFSYTVPEKYADTIIDGSLIYVADEDRGSHSIYVYVEDISGQYSDPEDVLAGYDISIKEEFGLAEESGIVEYNGLEYSHYLYDENNDGEHGFINIYVFANETGLIYIEFYDTATVYDMMEIKEFMNNVFLIQ